MSDWDLDESDAFDGWEKQSLTQRAMAARGAPYLEGLNPAQAEAVESLDGPARAQARPGR